MTNLDYLESERKKLWESVVELQESVKKKTSDYEKDAKQHSKKCSEYRNKCDAAKQEADRLLASINQVSVQLTKSNTLANIEEINNFHSALEEKRVF